MTLSIRSFYLVLGLVVATAYVGSAHAQTWTPELRTGPSCTLSATVFTGSGPRARLVVLRGPGGYESARTLAQQTASCVDGTRLEETRPPQRLGQPALSLILRTACDGEHAPVRERIVIAFSGRMESCDLAR